MKPTATPMPDEAARQARRVVAERALSIVFQPIFGFREGRIVGHEALVRGPRDSLVSSPQELFGAAQRAGVAVALNIVCIQEVLRAFSRRALEGCLFLNVSPQLIVQRGFEQERAARFMRALGLEARNVVIELTEDYPTSDFRFVHESLMLYRSMGLRVAIDDLGEGFASLRLWSELRPEYVKADKHFVRGIAADPVKLQFLRAIQHIAESSGSHVIAEGIEGEADFRLAKDIGIACGQGWFIGRPAETPNTRLSPHAQAAYSDARIPVVAPARLRAAVELGAGDFARAVPAADPQEPVDEVLRRFAAAPRVNALAVLDEGGRLAGVVSRAQLELAAASADCARLLARPCGELADTAPIRVDASLDLEGLAALLVESDARRFADGFVVTTGGRFLGMGSSADVMRALQGLRVLAARYTNPLTMLPGPVPMNEHLERLLRAPTRFTAWFAEVDQMRGLNDGAGFEKGDALIEATARLLEAACRGGLDFVGHVSGSRFAVLAQSEDWRERALRALEQFAQALAAQVPAQAAERGYFVLRRRDGGEQVRPLPKLAIGILPVLPGVFDNRHELLASAKQALRHARAQPASALHVDEGAANAYPQSMLY